MRLTHRLLATGALALCVPLAIPASPAGAATSPGRVVSVTVGHHATFDRVVFRFSGTGAAQHSVSYVSHVTSDPKGDVVPLRGSFFIRVVLHGVAGSNLGTPAPQNRIRPAFPQLREVAGAGDFEGVVSYGIGVSARTHFRVFTLSNPSRLVLDLPIASAGASSSPSLPATGAGTGALLGWGLGLLTAGVVALRAGTRLRAPGTP